MAQSSWKTRGISLGKQWFWRKGGRNRENASQSKAGMKESLILLACSVKVLNQAEQCVLVQIGKVAFEVGPG